MSDDPRLLLATGSGQPETTVSIVGKAECDAVLAELSETERAYARAVGFSGALSQIACLPGNGGEISRILFGCGGRQVAAEPMLVGSLAKSLPPGGYRISGPAGSDRLAALAFLLGGYRFDKFKKQDAERPRLFVDEDVDRDALLRQADAVYLTRDMINRPANDLGPEEIAGTMRGLADSFGADIEVYGGKPLEEAFPMVFAVGQASHVTPCGGDVVLRRTAVDCVHHDVTRDELWTHVAEGCLLVLIGRFVAGDDHELE